MHKPTILVVDDQLSNLQLLKVQLKEYNIIEASNGRIALRKISDEKPDLILLDIMMPGVDGYSVLSIVKNSRDTRHIPVVLVTSLTGSDDKIKSWEKGADDIISKPFNPVELKARIQSLLRIKNLQAEIDNVLAAFFTLITTVESKNDYTVNHSKRVAYYGERLAQAVAPELAETVRLGGQLHDIGTGAISDAIWLKPGKLTAEEYDTVKSHPVISEKICAPITAFNPILPFIRHHHEAYDGSGYPDGLKGEDIPLGARILAVANAFDALTSSRPYRAAYSVPEALAILREGAGKQWDPALVESFCAQIENQLIAICDK